MMRLNAIGLGSLLLMTLNLGFMSGPCLAITPKSSFNKVVAIINNDIITQNELDTEIKLINIRAKEGHFELPPASNLRQQVLDKLIMDKIQIQKAQEYGIEVDETLVDESIQLYSQNHNSNLQELKTFYETEGLPFSVFKEATKRDLIIFRLQHREIGPKLVLTQAEIDQTLRSPALQDQSGAEYHLGHILIALPSHPSTQSTKAKREFSEKLVKQLKAGASFGKLAATHSNDELALKGGDLGWRKLAEIPSLFTNYVATLEVGEVLGPIQSPSGFHIIKLLDKRSREFVQHEEIRLRQILVKLGPNRSDKEAENQLNKWRNQIIKGTPFTQLAQRFSEEASTSYKGGDLGWLRQDQLLPEFYNSIKTLKNSELGHPFKTPLGWHLVQVMGRRTTKSSSDALRNKAQEILHQRKFEEALHNWLRSIKEDAEIEIRA